MRRRLIALPAVVALVSLMGFVPDLAAQAADSGSGFSASKAVSRVHLVNGRNVAVDKRTVSVTVSSTQQLRDRQTVNVAWSGAHPTGGLVNDHNSAAAALQEYPVVVMQCRGYDSASALPGKRVTPQTCWTLTPAERFAYSPTGFIYPSYRMDRYATRTDRNLIVNQPDPLPDNCPFETAAHWIPYHAVDGTVYPGGSLGCAGLAPEAANAADSLQPGNTTYGVADAAGNGSTKFVIQDADTNASLGCSSTVACTLEVIPIEGVSCDAAGVAGGDGLGMPEADRPEADLVQQVSDECTASGRFQAGEFNLGGSQPDLSVAGLYWWSASNWRNRIAVPLTFAPSSSVCDVVGNSTSEYIYGSEALAQATQQWAPHFCLDKSLFTLRHVQTSEPQAKNLLSIGNVQAAVQAAPPSIPFARPTVQAPTALSGFAIAYSIDNSNGDTYPGLKLNARLLAKLLSESYRSCATCLDFTSSDARKSGFAALATNPIDMSRDPEFQALNPGVPETLYLQSAATLSVMSSDSDVMTALSSYINADPEARAWLNGAPDPWGMVVNPAYKHIALPVANWPLLDTHIPVLASGANQCLDRSPVPWLPLVASPLSNPATISLDLQFDIANSQINCKDNGSQNEKLTSIGRQTAGQRFVVGLVSLADARRYQLNVAYLQSHDDNAGSNGQFGSDAGRTFVAPNDANLVAAATLLKADRTAQTWVLPYNEMQSSNAGRGAYPGTFLISIDVPTTGLPAADAEHFRQLLDFVAGPGQTVGLGNGDLPPGYVPMTAANGLGEQVAYTRRAALAVAQQQGATWPLNSTAPAPTPTSSPPSTSPARTSTSPTSATTSPARSSASSSAAPISSAVPVSSGPITPQPIPSSGSTSPTVAASSSAAGSSGESPTPIPSTSSSPAAQSLGTTSDTTAGPLGLALPVLVLAGLVALGLTGWFSKVGRR